MVRRGEYTRANTFEALRAAHAEWIEEAPHVYDLKREEG
jgi:hypothetical protein